MKIVALHERTVPIASAIRNAYIDFSQMTPSLVARRDRRRARRAARRRLRLQLERPLRAGRAHPRAVRAAAPRAPIRRRCSTTRGRTSIRDRVWAALMRNEKPGGHGERSVAVGTIDMAVWDAVAKIAGKPLFRLLAERYGVAGRSARLRLRRRRLLLPGQGPRRAPARDARATSTAATPW